MTENFNLALQLLVVGMLSVFLILGIVVGLGKILVSLVNRYSPEVVKTKPLVKKSKAIEAKKLAVLTAVVDMVSQQKGVIKSVKKI